MRAGLIYQYESPSGKVYIGQTINESHRRVQHKNQAKNPKDYFHRAIAKYGFESFKYSVLFRTASNDVRRLKFLLDIMERYFIKKYNSTNKDKGYNLTTGGESVYNLSEDVRYRLGVGNRGKNRTDEIKEKISTTLKAKYESGERIVHNKRAISMYKNGVYIKDFDSVDAARLELNIAYTSITNILKGRAKKTRQGYTFIYKEKGGTF